MLKYISLRRKVASCLLVRNGGFIIFSYRSDPLLCVHSVFWPFAIHTWERRHSSRFQLARKISGIAKTQLDSENECCSKTLFSRSTITGSSGHLSDDLLGQSPKGDVLGRCPKKMWQVCVWLVISSPPAMVTGYIALSTPHQPGLRSTLLCLCKSFPLV